MGLPNKELICLTDNIYHEARGESIEGQLAVALVTLNRASLGKTVCDTVYAKKQFSWTRHKTTVKDKLLWFRVREVAMLAHEQPDILGTFPATHYHNHTVRPNWGLRYVAKIGRHTFYK